MPDDVNSNQADLAGTTGPSGPSGATGATGTSGSSGSTGSASEQMVSGAEVPSQATVGTIQLGGKGGAPVKDAAPPLVTPQVAPVSDFRAAQGVELTKKLLNILTLSILILVMYLFFLDSRTSENVDHLYVNAFRSLEVRADTRHLAQLASLHDVFATLIKDPKKELPLDIKLGLARLSDNLHLDDSDAKLLTSCVSLVNAPKAGGKDTIEDSSQNLASEAGKPQDGGPAPMVPAGGDHPALNLGRCVEFVESLQFAGGGPIDTERLRLMRDFAKDMQENHQGLRTFWLSATQLILVNVLLPLLTALLGYIFGRQSTS